MFTGCNLIARSRAVRESSTLNKYKSINFDIVSPAFAALRKSRNVSS